MNQKAAWQARIWLAQENLDAVSQWAEDRRLDTHKNLTYLHEMEYLVLARILFVQGRLDDTARLLQHLHKSAETGGRAARMIEILNIQALVFQAEGNTSQAVTTLERALALAEPGGFIRIFVDEGLPMARLLSKADAHGIMPDYIGKLLAVFEAKEQPDENTSYRSPPSPDQPLIEPLSQRELEVLHLIAQGLSNREISEQLFLALSTIKGHNQKIFAKLQVQRRTEAVARARELGLV